MLLHHKNTRPRFRWNLDKEDAIKVLKAAYIAEVNARCKDYIDDVKTNKMIDRTAEILTKQRPKLGIMFCGTCGNGKTTMLNAIRSANDMLKEMRYFDELRAYSYDVSISVLDAREMAEIGKDYDIFKKYKRLDMIAIEDLGKESAETLNYGNVINPTMDMIESRYASQKYTLITTNLTAKEIRAKYGARIADRFNEMLDVVIFEDGTYRK